MNDKESALQMKEQIKSFSDFVQIAWDALSDNVLTEDDNENFDLMTDAFFNVIYMIAVAEILIVQNYILRRYIQKKNIMI